VSARRLRGTASAVARRYREFLGLPDTKALLAVALIARMPIGMMSLALLMHLRALVGSFATAGAIVGGYLIASAVVAPVLGRTVDRHGPTGVLALTGAVQPSALLLILLAQPLGLAVPAIAALACLAGALAPPIAVLTRTLWRHRFPDGELRRTAFAVDAVLVEINFTIGPALIALLLAFAAPSVAFGAAVVFAAAAAPLFLTSPAPHYWWREPAGPPQGRTPECAARRYSSKAHPSRASLIGPLANARLLHIYAISFSLAFVFGLLEVGYPGFATRAGVPAMGGVLIAINSIGSAMGGITYGGLALRAPIERQLTLMLAVLALPIAAHALVSSPWLLALPAVLAGLLIAPAISVVSTLVATNAPGRHATEAFTWQGTAIISGVGAGMAVGGVLVDFRGPAATFLLGAVSALTGSALASTLRHAPTQTLAPPAHEARPAPADDTGSDRRARSDGAPLRRSE
jgi:MFS family permease